MNVGAAEALANRLVTIQRTEDMARTGQLGQFPYQAAIGHALQGKNHEHKMKQHVAPDRAKDVAVLCPCARASKGGEVQRHCQLHTRAGLAGFLDTLQAMRKKKPGEEPPILLATLQR